MDKMEMMLTTDKNTASLQKKRNRQMIMTKSQNSHQSLQSEKHSSRIVMNSRTTVVTRKSSRSRITVHSRGTCNTPQTLNSLESRNREVITMLETVRQFRQQQKKSQESLQKIDSQFNSSEQLVFYESRAERVTN